MYLNSCLSPQKNHILNRLTVDFKFINVDLWLFVLSFECINALNKQIHSLFVLLNDLSGDEAGFDRYGDSIHANVSFYIFSLYVLILLFQLLRLCFSASVSEST